MVWLETLPDEWWKSYQSSSLSYECIREIDIELLFLIRSLLLETRTYARVCKRVRLLTIDFQHALYARNIRRSKSDIKQSEESVISISSIIQQFDQLPPNIDRIQLTMHWLAIDGEQPIIPENPFPNFYVEHTFSEKKIIPSQLTDQSPLLQRLYELANSTKTKLLNFFSIVSLIFDFNCLELMQLKIMFIRSQKII